jgi:LmbE family N-acetylglucosaminyl deacetylase
VDAFDIAAVCAHPDDAELVMGGTIAREAARGRRVALVDLTRGESGSRGTPETRAAEAAEAARILGAAHRESLGLPDAAAGRPAHRTRWSRRSAVCARVVRGTEQATDHAAASRIVYDACFSRLNRPDLGPAFRPTKPPRGDDDRGVRLSPTFVVDVTASWPTKLRRSRSGASSPPPWARPVPDRREAVSCPAGVRPADRRAVRQGHAEPLAGRPDEPGHVRRTARLCSSRSITDTDETPSGDGTRNG